MAILLALLMQFPNRLRIGNADNHVSHHRGDSTKGGIRKALENACKEVDIPYGRFEQGGFIFHDLRHTFTTIARRAKIPRNVIMTITGHTANDMNFRYDTVDENDLLEGVDQIEAYLESLDQNVGQAPPLKKKGISQNQPTP